MKRRWALADLPRPESGLVFTHAVLPGEMRPSGRPGLAFGKASDGSLRLPLPGLGGLFSQVHLLVAFEPIFSSTSTLSFCRADVFAGDKLVRTKSVEGIAIQRCLKGDSTDETFFGDGSGFLPVGCVNTGKGHIPVALLTIHLDPTEEATELRLDFAPKSEFTLFDVFLEFTSAVACPFHSASTGVSLAELASVIRIGDRVRFDKAIEQLSSNMRRASTLDEARGFSLSFVAVVCAAMLELGAPRTLPQLMLRLARTMDELEDVEQIISHTVEQANKITESVLKRKEKGHAALMDEAVEFVARNFGQSLDDDSMARELGLSASHFRYLFRQATGKPFHQYLLGVRLEQARQLITDHGLTVSETALRVGFQSPAHFTRAFIKRFGIKPSAI